MTSPILAHGQEIKPTQYNNPVQIADQKLWRVRYQDIQKKKPTRRSISPLRERDRTENKPRTQCPGENVWDSKTMAATWPIRIAPMPHSTNTSLRPPATAPSPVALL